MFYLEGWPCPFGNIFNPHERLRLSERLRLERRNVNLRAEGGFKDALQLRIKRYGQIRFAQVPERVSTKSLVVLIRGYSSRIT